MPNRYVREAAIESEAVNTLSWQAEVLYRRLINLVDDFGRFTANPVLVRSKAFPLQIDLVTPAQTEALLQECHACGLIFFYEAEGKRLLVMNKWEKGRAQNSHYADPPKELLEQMKTFVYRPKHMSPTPTPGSDPDAGLNTHTHASAGEVKVPAEDVGSSVASQPAGENPEAQAGSKATNQPRSGHHGGHPAPPAIADVPGSSGVDSEVPDEDQAVLLVMTAGIAEEFVRFVHRAWSGRGGRDGVGQRRGWREYVLSRWATEGADWREGTHYAQKRKPGAGPPSAPGQGGGGGGGSGASPAGQAGQGNAASTIYALTAKMAAKEKAAKELFDRHASEGPLTTEWTSPARRDEYRALKHEIKELNRQIAAA